MVDNKTGAVGRYLLRLFGGVAFIVGVLGLFVGLTQPNPGGAVFAAILAAVGAFMFRRSGGFRGPEQPARGDDAVSHGGAGRRS